MELLIIFLFLIPLAVIAFVVWFVYMMVKERRLTKKLLRMEAEDQARIRAEELEAYRSQTPPRPDTYRHGW